MDELLTPVRTTGGSADEQLLVQEVEVNEVHYIPGEPFSSPGDALDALRSKPDFKTLKRILQYLDPDAPGGGNIDTDSPGPGAAKLVNILVSSVIPDYWVILGEKNGPRKTWAHPNERTILLRCLSGVSGLGAILARLQTLIAFSKEGKGKIGSSDISQHIADLLGAIEHLLESKAFILGVWGNLKRSADIHSKRIGIWKEFVSIVGGGKFLSIVAEALDILKASRKDIVRSYWVADGGLYCAWIGQSIARMAVDLQEDDLDAWKAVAQLLGKSFSLGYMG
jgi:telomere length regulation protein